MKPIIYMMMLNSISMYYIKNPLSMGMFILIQTLLTCLVTGMLINTYWFSYILFLTFLGGLMVLFIYVCSIASNELMKFSFNLMFMFIIIAMMMTLYNYYSNKTYFNMNSDMNIMNNYFIFNKENKMINLSKLYNEHNYMLTLMLIIYLFITLIVIVMINNIYSGPLRSNFN